MDNTQIPDPIWTQTSAFAEMAFHHPFRKYQTMILNQAANGEGDHRHHIAAPPGAGKTIVGIELLRRWGEPAVIFAPTTTIQEQWREKVGLFLPPSAPADALNALVSRDPARLAPINLFTYQLISTPGEAQAHVEAMARRQWVDELIDEGHILDEAAAWARLETLEANNPRSYRSELSRRYRRVKRALLYEDDVDIRPFLHPNAQALIDNLIAYGVRTVVLDECHHLLDYWAIVLRHFISRIETPRVVGLTATLPNPEEDRAYENYTSLLGEVDFQVPTPAVVKEGDLAPYRDLVYFVTPTERELAYLTDIQSAFETAIAELTESPRFCDWVEEQVMSHVNPFDETKWAYFLRSQPVFSLAGLRFLERMAYAFPAGMLLPQEMSGEMTLADWAALLERYGLNVLKVSPDPEDHAQLRRLRKTLLPFGLTLTERGLRQGRSPGDLVLTFSEAKDAAVAEILTFEATSLGDRLRAVVVTDFERMSSGAQRKRLEAVLDRSAGSAVRVFTHLVNHPDVGKLDPILTTGRTLMVDADHGAELLTRFHAYLESQGLRATCEYQETDLPHVLEIVGRGADWSSRTYVRMVTDAFEAGITRCLVGTRGIFGEGWDALGLNTLVDLTSVTTSASVQQLRGRTIRIDPAWQGKLAHNWDVVCVAPTFDRGDIDLKRLARRHERYWGVVPASQARQAWEEAHANGKALSSGARALAQNGFIVKGLNHVDPQLAHDLYIHGFKQIDYGRYTRRMLREIGRRGESYRLWAIGSPYDNFEVTAARLDARDLRIRTRYTFESALTRILRALLNSILLGVMLVLGMACPAGLAALLLSEGALRNNLMTMCGTVSLILGVGFLAVLAVNAFRIRQLARALLIEPPPDSVLRDIGMALLSALQQASMVSSTHQPDDVRVIEQPNASYDVLLERASPEDAATFIAAYQEIFEPVRDQRYIILRDGERLPNPVLAGLWRRMRPRLRDAGLYRPAYHPVPKRLGARKDLAQAFAKAWERYVGGGELVYTRSEEGRQLLLHARTQERPRVRGMAFDMWR